MAGITRHQNLMEGLFGPAYRAGWEGQDCPPPPAGGEGMADIWKGMYEDGAAARRQAAEYQAANPPPADDDVVWGVAYRTARMEPGTHITSYLSGDLTEEDARWMAERWQTEQAHIVEAWAEAGSRRRLF